MKMENIKATNARNLLSRLVFPETIDLGMGKSVNTAKVARAIVEDDHPGDDCVPPRWLRVTACDIVKLNRLALEPVNITGEAARLCCDAYNDELCCLGNAALSDLEDFGSMTPENSALVLVLARLMIEADTKEATLN